MQTNDNKITANEMKLKTFLQSVLHRNFKNIKQLLQAESLTMGRNSMYFGMSWSSWGCLRLHFPRRCLATIAVRIPLMVFASFFAAVLRLSA